jgi:PAS domain-containing protein
MGYGMNERADAAAVDVDALMRENERLRSNVKYLETHFRRLEAFVNSAPFLIYIKNSERQYTMFSPVRERQFKLATDDVLWHTDPELAGNRWGTLSFEQDGKALSGQIVEGLEASPRANDGSNWLVVRFPFVDADGERFVGAVGLDVSRYLP